MRNKNLLQGKQDYTSLARINRNQRPFVNIGGEQFNRAQNDSADPVMSKSAGSHLNYTRFLAAGNGKDISKIKIFCQDSIIMRFGVCHNFGIRSIRGADK